MRDYLTRAWLTQTLAEAVAFVRAAIRRALEMGFIERSVALASLTFTAMIPLGVVTGSILPTVGSRHLADSFIHRFRLHGDTAELVRSVFAPPEDVRSAVSVLGVILLVVAALSFTRGLQRAYERSWLLASRGVRGTPAGLMWLGGVVVFLALFSGLRTALVDLAGPLPGVIVALAFSAAIWLATPYVLLSRRVAWRALVPTALLTAGLMTALSTASVIFMPTVIADSAARYGQIGVAIAIVSWLVTAGFVLVGSAIVGALLAEYLGLYAGEPSEGVPNEPTADATAERRLPVARWRSRT